MAEAGGSRNQRDSVCPAHYTQKPRYNVLLLGISASGKTAWLDRVRSKVTRTGSRSLSRFHPTVGQNGA